MPDTVAELARRGRALSLQDREQLVELLVDSLADSPDPVIEEAWRVEIGRRVASYDRGEAVLHEADDVLAEAKLLAP